MVINNNESKMMVTGIGFGCIDIIKRSKQTKLQLGGTAANVLSILSELGFKTSMFLPKYNDQWEEYMKRELNGKGVHTIEFANTSLSTPRVIEIVDDKGRKHNFYTICPKCGKKLNTILLPSIKQIQLSNQHLKGQNVIFFDRVSPGVKKAMEIGRKANAWIFYEPNGCRVYKQLLTTAKTVDILKFSNDRISDLLADRLREDLFCENTKIIIVTLGKEGVKFAYRTEKDKLSSWIYLASNKVEHVVDTSGAGDWLTSAFLYYFLPMCPKNINDIKEELIVYALQKAQLMSAYSCGFLGAQEVFGNKELVLEFNQLFNMNIEYVQQSDIPENHEKVCSYCGLII